MELSLCIKSHMKIEVFLYTGQKKIPLSLPFYLFFKNLSPRWFRLIIFLTWIFQEMTLIIQLTLHV